MLCVTMPWLFCFPFYIVLRDALIMNPTLHSLPVCFCLAWRWAVPPMFLPGAGLKRPAAPGRNASSGGQDHPTWTEDTSCPPPSLAIAQGVKGMPGCRPRQECPETGRGDVSSRCVRARWLCHYPARRVLPAGARPGGPRRAWPGIAGGRPEVPGWRCQPGESRSQSSISGELVTLASAGARRRDVVIPFPPEWGLVVKPLGAVCCCVRTLKIIGCTVRGCVLATTRISPSRPRLLLPSPWSPPIVRQQMYRGAGLLGSPGPHDGAKPEY